jgi:hypothetical protein
MLSKGDPGSRHYGDFCTIFILQLIKFELISKWKAHKWSREWWYRSVIPTKAEIGGLWFKAKVRETLSHRNKLGMVTCQVDQLGQS